MPAEDVQEPNSLGETQKLAAYETAGLAGLGVTLPPPPRKRRWPRRVVLASTLAGFLVGGTTPIDPELRALAAALSQSAGCVVAPEEIRWEPSDGAFTDLVRGRKVLFLGRAAPGAPRDVYRARVRVTWEGRPLGITGVYNLTSTPLGDDHSLVVRDARAAFATSAFGQAQSVSILGLAPGANGSEAKTLGERAMAWLTALQETGDGNGIRRIDATLDPPARRVGLALEGGALKVDVERDKGVERTALDLAAIEARGSDDANAAPTLGGRPGDLKIEVASRPPKKLVHWAVDTVRAVSWIGPAPIAWLEERVFALRDEYRRVAFQLGGSDDQVRADAQDLLSRPRSGAAGDAPSAAVPVVAGRVGDATGKAEEEPWPPTAIQSIWKTPEPGEGEWVAPKVPWIKRLDVPGAPSAFMRTYVRPDTERPYARVLLVAMDMRRLDLEMEAGSEDPKPLVGPAGPGRLPRDPAIANRVVAAFNGAFKTEHGFHGMMVKKRVLLPPQPNVATVILTKDGRAGFGTWGPMKEVVGVRGVPAADIVSLRQNLDPLVDRGEVNPQKRNLWGFTLPGTSMQTERSGVCVTAAGHVIYAWGDDVSGITLAKGMKMAGCTYGMHLDMNPHHTGFLFANIDDLRTRKYRTELLSTDMEIPNDRYLEHSAKDFFYVLTRDPSPPPLARGAWTASASRQPAPAWFPGLFDAEVATTNGAVALFDVEAGRAGFRLRRGANEPDPGTGSHTAPQLLDETESPRVLFAIGMGVAHEKRPRGFVVKGRVLAASHGVTGTAMLVAESGVLSIRRDDEIANATAETDAVELPLLFSGTDTFSHAPPIPGAMRSALGLTDEGRVVVARAHGATDAALTEALRSAGCTRGVLLDRGGANQGIFDRSGTPSAPRAAYDESVIYGVAQTLRPRAFRFEAETAIAAAPGK
jgi:hypothetical protein